MKPKKDQEAVRLPQDDLGAFQRRLDRIYGRKREAPPSARGAGEEYLRAQAFAMLRAAHEYSCSDADLAWARLEVAAEHAARGDVEAAEDLIKHFGGASLAANRNPDELLRQLGLLQNRGRKPPSPLALHFGQLIRDLEVMPRSKGKVLGPEMAIRIVGEAMAAMGEPVFDRATLRRWRDAAAREFSGIEALSPSKPERK